MTAPGKNVLIGVAKPGVAKTGGAKLGAAKTGGGLLGKVGVTPRNPD